jgi:hypothetical protein
MSYGAACADTWGRAAYFIEWLLKALRVSISQSIRLLAEEALR